MLKKIFLLVIIALINKTTYSHDDFPVSNGPLAKVFEQIKIEDPRISTELNIDAPIFPRHVRERIPSVNFVTLHLLFLSDEKMFDQTNADSDKSVYRRNKGALEQLALSYLIFDHYFRKNNPLIINLSGDELKKLSKESLTIINSYLNGTIKLDHSGKNSKALIQIANHIRKEVFKFYNIEIEALERAAKKAEDKESVLETLKRPFNYLSKINFT